MRIITGLFFLLISIHVASAQQKDANFILQKVKEKANAVRDYQADANIKVKVDFVRIPERNARVYYKQPNKIKFKSQGFAMLPKKGIGNFQSNFLNGNYTAIYVSSEKLNGILTDVVKIIPTDANSETIISTVWVDANYLVRKIETSTRAQGTYVINLEFGNNPFDLPSALNVSFDVNKSEIPIGISFDIDAMRKKQDAKKTSKGEVTIKYSNYIVNKGIADSFFAEEKKK